MQRITRIRLATSALALTATFMAGQVLAGQGTVDFTANIKTTEFLLPAPNCTSQTGGIGAGVGSTNLFTKKPATDRTSVVLTSFDCVTDNQNGSLTFGPGLFTLTGPGGEMIFATYSGTLVFQSANAATGVVTFEFQNDAMFHITGGTGKYSKATGAGTISGTEAVNQVTKTAQGNLTATGKIIY